VESAPWACHIHAMNIALRNCLDTLQGVLTTPDDGTGVLIAEQAIDEYVRKTAQKGESVLAALEALEAGVRPQIGNPETSLLLSYIEKLRPKGEGDSERL
jgi:hypothetical protein